MDKKENILKEIEIEKKAKNYFKMLSLYGKLLEIDMMDFETYYSIGKLYYILEDLDASVRYHLISIHLSLLESNEIIKTNSTLAKEMKETIKNYKDLVEPVKKIDGLLVNLILYENNLIHLAHSLIDENIKDLQGKKIYLELLKGENATIDERYLKTQKNFYFPVGFLFSAVIIDPSLKKQDIVEQYFSLDGMEIKTTYKKIIKLYEDFKDFE